MFNRKLEVKLVKDDKTPRIETQAETINRINSKESLLEVGKFVVLGSVIVIGVSIALKTAGQIVLKSVK